MRRPHSKKMPLAALAALLAAGSAAAAEPTFKLSGFGTLAATHMSSDKADFKGAVCDVPNGAGRTESTSLRPDSRFALQVDASFGDNIDAVAQVLTRQNRFNNYEPSLEMLNVKYRIDNNTSVRLGRIAHPFFMASDSRLVGYAFPFVRGPVEVYNQSQIYNSDVVQLSHRMPLAGGNAVVTVGTGSSRYGNPTSNAALGKEDIGNFKRLVFGDVNWEIGSLTLRLGHSTGVNSFDANGTKALYAGAALANAQLADELSLLNKRVSFTGLGLVYDPGQYLVQAEYTMTRWGLGDRSVVPDANAFYVLGGWRIDKFTPFVMYGKRSTDTPRVVTQFPSAQLNGAFTGYAANTANAQHTLSLGLRWDVRPNVAVKTQFDRMTVDAKSGASYLTNANPANRPKQGDQFNILAVSLDFVF